MKILNEGFGSEVSWIYNVERHYTGGVSYSWNSGSRVNFSEINQTYIANLSSPPSSTHMLYYANSYYSLPDINIFGNDTFNRSVLKAFDALKIIKAIASKTLAPLIFVNRAGTEVYPVSLNYYTKLYDDAPFGKHPLEALKLLADSMMCYIFIDKAGRFVIQKKTNLGELNNGTERVFNSIRLSEASIPRRYFWDKIIDGIKTKITSDGYLNCSVSKQIFQNIKPRNELDKEIIALNSVEFTSKSMSDYASDIADGYLNFYGKRHESFLVDMSLYDDLLDWELLDYISIAGKTCFFSGIEIDIVGREFHAELITVQGEGYYKGQANVPLSIDKYNKTSNGGYDSGSSTGESTVSQNIYSGYSAELPVQIESSVIKLCYEDNLKLSSNHKLDTIQDIKTSSIPQFAGLSVGGAADALYKGKFYGDLKVTGKIDVDGDFNIGGSINEINITELNVSDKTISLNKGGSDATSPESGIKILGTAGLTIASIIYDPNFNWRFNKSIDLQSGYRYKINNIEVISADSLGAGIVNSSLTKVGSITQGAWCAAPVNAPYINYNSSHFQNISNQLSAKSITAGSNNGVIISGVFNLGGAIMIDTSQDIRTAASPLFNGITLNNGTLNSNSDITISLAGNSILPNTGYAYNLGSLSKKYLTLHAAELWVETLVSQNTKATIGGRVLIGESNELINDLSATDFFINVKYNNFTGNDIIYLEADSKVEFMKVLYLTSSAPGNYEYEVQRNLDGTGANQWYAGDALFNTGNIGDGFIDLYSIKGIKGISQCGPTIAGNVRNSLTYNDWTENWAIGNLSGLYGYTTNIFGAGLGKYANNSSYVTIDSVNGFAIKHKDDSGTEIKVIELNASGSGFFRGNITSSATITGGIIQTASAGKRVRIAGDGNDIKFYNSAGEYISVEGYLSAGNEKRLNIGGTILGGGDLWITGSGQLSGSLSVMQYVNAVGGYRIDDVEIVDVNCNASFNNLSANEINVSKFKLLGNDLITDRPAASKILVSDASRKIVVSAVAAGELFTPAMCELYDSNANSTIVCDGTTYVKWTNATVGLTKNIEGSTSSDCVVISTGCGGVYTAQYNITFSANTINGYYWALKVGTYVIEKSRSSIVVLNTGSLVQISGGCLLQLSDGDQVSVGCFGSYGNVVSVCYVNLRLVKNSN